MNLKSHILPRVGVSGAVSPFKFAPQAGPPPCRKREDSWQGEFACQDDQGLP
jgi:hypothetical protein